MAGYIDNIMPITRIIILDLLIKIKNVIGSVFELT